MKIKIIKAYDLNIDTDNAANRVSDYLNDDLVNYIDDEFYDILYHENIDENDINQETIDTIKREIVNKVIKNLIDKYRKDIVNNAILVM